MFTANNEENITNLKHSARNTGEAAKAVTADAKEELSQAANSAGRKIRKFVHDASDEIVHAKDTVTDQIHSKPMQSSLIALGLGFILGALIRR